MVEASTEYIEDPKGIIARNEAGKVIRMKLKVTIGYKGNNNSQGNFKNAQV